MEATRLTTLLTWAVTGTYLLVALGATAAATGGGGFVPALHYAAAGGVGLVLTAAVIVAWTGSAPAPVRWAVTATLVGYPIQAAIGASVVAGGPGGVGGLHLFGGVAVFAVLLAALVSQLEHESGTVSGDMNDFGPRPAVSEPTSTSAGGDSPDAVTRGTAGGSSVADDSVAPSSPDDTSGGPSAAGVLDTVRAYVALTKPRLMWLLCLLALAGMGLAAAVGGSLDGGTVVATLAGGVLAIGASGTFNHAYERDRDRLMDRTADRPVATENVSRTRAALFGVVLAVLSLAVLFVAVNLFAAVLTAAAIVYYSVVYTVLLKPTTRYNTVIGGGAGALPAVIGYVAVADGVGLAALLLAAVVFCWTPAHFYNLAIAHREDYARASYPMLPVVDGVAVTRRRILFWLGVTLLVAVWLGSVADLGSLYAVTTALLGGVFVWSVVQQYRLNTDGAAYRSFHASNAYLGFLLAAILLETVVL